MELTQQQKDNFWEKVNKSDGCWEWTGALVGGKYGRLCLTVDGKIQYLLAHRVSYVLVNGDIPEHDSYHGMCVLHKCDNTVCVNPSHLTLGTQQENLVDMMNKGRKSLKPSEVLEVRNLSQEGQNQTELATSFKVNRETISNIISRKTWAWL